MKQLNTMVVLLYLLSLLFLFNESLSNLCSLQEVRGKNAASNVKGIWKDVNIETSSENFGLRGRKMGSFGSLMKGKGESERERERESSIRNLLSNKRGELTGFVAMNADYKGPRHHPPKNN